LINRYFPALKFWNFRLFWVGQLISLVGTWMQSTILPYLSYRLSGDPLYLGAIGFAGAIPAFFLTLPGGVLIERVDKRKAVVFMQSLMMVQAFTLAFLTLTGRITIWWILVMSLIIGIANSIEVTARQSMFVDLVGKEALPNAIALNAVAFNAARVIGPLFTTPFILLMQDAGEGWAFLVNGISYMVVIGSLIAMRFPEGNLRKRPLEDKLPGIQEFVVGQNFVRHTPLVLALIMMIAIPSLVGFPFTQMLPVFAQDVLRTTADTYSQSATRNSLLVTGQGVGALIAAVFIAAGSQIPHKGRLLIIGQMVFGIGLITLGFSRTITSAVTAMVLVGAGMILQMALTNTLIQLSVPDHLRGRVVSTYLWTVQGAAPFGSLFLGWLVGKIGAPLAVILGGSVCLASYLIFIVVRPELRKVEL
jgi:MFS family permease